MAKRDLLKLPDDFEGNLRALLATPPAPHGTAGSRKIAPKPPAKPKRKKRAPLTPGPEPSQAALEAQRRHLNEKLVEKLKEGAKPKARKRKATKKRRAMR
jgi:hypothetical protein